MQRLRSAVELQTVGTAETDREANGRMGCWGLGSDALPKPRWVCGSLIQDDDTPEVARLPSRRLSRMVLGLGRVASRAWPGIRAWWPVILLVAATTQMAPPDLASGRGGR